MFDAGNLAHDALERLNRPGRHLVGRCPCILHEDIDHGHGDLGILLTRRQDQAHDAHQHHGKVKQRRQG